MITETDPALAKRAYFFVDDLLVEKGEYELASSFVGDPQIAFDRSVDMRRVEERTRRSNPILNTPEFQKHSDNRFVTKTLNLIRVLIATGREPEAASIQSQALEILDDDRLRPAVNEEARTHDTEPALQIRLVAGREEPDEQVDLLPMLEDPTRELRVEREVKLDDSVIKHAGIDFAFNGSRAIQIRLTDAGARRFAEVTGANIGKQVAIVHRGKILTAPAIGDRITGGRIQLTFGSMESSQMHELVDALNKSNSRTIEHWTLGPVEERTIASNPHPDRSIHWLDLDTGMTRTNSTLNWQTRDGHAWIRTNGLDLAAVEASRNGPAIHAFDINLVRIPDENRDPFTAADVVQSWNLMQDLPRQWQVISPTTEEPTRYIFQTSEGGRGLVEFTTSTNTPNQANVRYQLVLRAGKTTE